jgi:hypothetical protein
MHFFKCCVSFILELFLWFHRNISIIFCSDDNVQRGEDEHSTIGQLLSTLNTTKKADEVCLVSCRTSFYLDYVAT